MSSTSVSSLEVSPSSGPAGLARDSRSRSKAAGKMGRFAIVTLRIHGPKQLGSFKGVLGAYIGFRV